jgi:hypothetical protein
MHSGNQQKQVKLLMVGPVILGNGGQIPFDRGKRRELDKGLRTRLVKVGCLLRSTPSGCVIVTFISP